MILPNPDRPLRLQGAAVARDRHRTAKISLVAAVVVLALWIDLHLLPALIWAAILAIATAPVHTRLSRAHPRLRHGVLLPAIFTAVFALAVLVPLGLAAAEGRREWSEALEWIASARTNGVAVPAWVSQLPLGSGWLLR